MKKWATIFLQVVIILIALTAVFVMIQMPLAEGRVVDLDLFSIYADPFIIGAYTASIPFFLGLYKGFRIMRYIRQGRVFSPEVSKALEFIQYCPLIIIAFVILGVISIALHHGSDDPIGGYFVGILITFASLIVVAAATVLQGVVEQGMSIGGNP